MNSLSRELVREKAPEPEKFFRDKGGKNGTGIEELPFILASNAR